MAVVKTLSVSAENTFSSKFYLSGDGAGWPRRAIVCSTSSASKVTIRRYGADGVTVIASLVLDSVMASVEVPVGGMYDVGVAAGSYGGTAMTITVEQ